MDGRRLIVTENSSADGVIDLSGGWFQPPGIDAGEDRSDMEAVVAEQREASGGLILGRVTFEQFRGFWPKQVDEPSGITEHLNRTQKYVFSSTLQDPEWENTTILRGPLADDLRALKAQPGNDLVLGGSVTLAQAAVATGLVDEYRLFVFPVVVGEGGRLFDGATGVPPLRLLECRPFRSGIVLLRYGIEGGASDG